LVLRFLASEAASSNRLLTSLCENGNSVILTNDFSV
jgi:hypothetical protein